MARSTCQRFFFTQDVILLSSRFWIYRIAEEDKEYFLSEIEKRLYREEEFSSFYSPSRLTYGMAKFAYEKILNKDQHQERQLCLQTRKAFQAVGADETDLDCMRPRELILNFSEILGENIVNK